MYSSLGFEYFAALYLYILNKYHTFGGGLGKLINVLEYDCNLISNLVYSMLTSIFCACQLLVLFNLLIYYLHGSYQFIIIIVAFLLSQFWANRATFITNKRYVSQKDKRLNANVGVGDMLKERKK